MVPKDLSTNSWRPLSSIDDILIQASRGRWFSKLDLSDGFWHIALDPASRDITTFAVPGRGLYRFRVLPQGLKTSPTDFQRVMEEVLRDLLDSQKVHLYIDDIIVNAETREECYVLTKQVLQRLRKVGLQANQKKCVFLTPEMDILGHELSFDQIKPSRERIRILDEMPRPKQVKALRRALGATGFLRSFIPNYAEIVAPLTSLTFYIQVDASDSAVGAVLFQDGDGERRIIHIASRKFSETERRWSTSERECFGALWSLETFDPYFRGSAVTLFTDHQCLLHLMTSNSPKLRRWAMRMARYAPEIAYIRGDHNLLADWLSRLYEEELKAEEELAVPICFAEVDQIPRIPPVGELI
eukprot:Blabericola_migrator_1__4786@NODE_2517_length_2654_cov_120_530731_g1552_i1_p1_GENE_NODE_2517_length_2654_cov_120_530731_g1552_i1NODE_2517_length_2654_cov_120_530731_g1552_i1_p1_ORF_typecomplete_len356_score47_66RT_RNaseH/PF17917_1/4_5e03RT_RNaseH/PF17917_1/2_8e28RVT_1/PF00078_27/5_9e23RT_RNaseH_2/PF17919_1/6_3e18DUF1699/PF08004_11/0_021_NODE_2517_length_2654_cov_120_530731_g1552_i115292596